MPAFAAAYDSMSQEDRRGMRLDEIMRGTLDDTVYLVDKKKTHSNVLLDDHAYQALLQRLKMEGSAFNSSGRDVPGLNARFLSKFAVSYATISISGVLYKCRTRAQGDSNVIFHHPAFDGEEPGRIEQIFVHKRAIGSEAVEDIFLVMRKLIPLSTNDLALDPYRSFSVGGSLYYDEYEAGLFVARPNDVVCHFAKTYMKGAAFTRKTTGPDGQTYANPIRFEKPCVHVMKLGKVGRSGGRPTGAKAESSMDSCFAPCPLDRRIHLQGTMAHSTMAIRVRERERTVCSNNNGNRAHLGPWGRSRIRLA